MRHGNGNRICSWRAAALLVVLACGSPLGHAAAPATDSPSGDIVTGIWQHHKAAFSYFGVTTLYTCDGLEGHVGQILRHLGARKDVQVSARGCPGPYNTPSHTAWVEADFYTLAPAAAAASAAETVDARWTPMEVTARRPFFMSEGDCELVQEMKDLIVKNFSLRDVEYRAECVPYQYTQNAFSIKGQALTALPPSRTAASRPTRRKAAAG